MADRFVRVRLTRIDNTDLSLFEFDYDLTMMVFFLNADEKVYARYGGRDARNADARQSLDGLAYTMKSVLEMHAREEKAFAARTEGAPKSVRELAGQRGMGRGCMHCHQVKEAIQGQLRRSGKWDRDAVWRYPLPENLGFDLEIDRGNVVKEVKEKSTAADAGLKAGDVLRRLNGVPVHSFADAQFGLDRAPKAGAVEVVWQRGEQTKTAKLTLAEGWRKSDISWRPSLAEMVPSPQLFGDDLTAEEKKALGLKEKQLAFRQKDSVPLKPRTAGVRGGDVILGFDDRSLEADVNGFVWHVRRNYLVGDRVTINLLRDGKPMQLTMTLGR